MPALTPTGGRQAGETHPEGPPRSLHLDAQVSDTRRALSDAGDDAGSADLVLEWYPLQVRVYLRRRAVALPLWLAGWRRALLLYVHQYRNGKCV